MPKSSSTYLKSSSPFSPSNPSLHSYFCQCRLHPPKLEARGWQYFGVVCFLSQPLNAGETWIWVPSGCSIFGQFCGKLRRNFGDRCMSRHMSISGFPVRRPGWAQATEHTAPAIMSSMSNGSFLRRLEATIFISSSVVCGRHILLHMVTLVFELCVSNSAVSAVWQSCNVQWLPTRMGCDWHWLCPLVITAAHCIGSDRTLIHFCD